jgi:hypothetical protein
LYFLARVKEKRRNISNEGARNDEGAILWAGDFERGQDLMGRRNVTAREHKLLLKARRFAGNEKEMLKAVRGFWRDLAPVLRDLNIRKEGKFDNIAKKQVVRVYDTKALRLRNNYTILRSRVNLDNDKNELTLKFRHPDRYISQERDATAGLP